jgi:hypothetical protein
MKWTYLLAFMSSGCLADAWSNLQDNFTTTATTGGSSTTSGTVPTTSDGANSSPVATVTGPPDESSSAATTLQEPETTTGDMINLPPTIELFTVTPKDLNEKQLSEAGPAELQLVASDDVVKVRLSLDGVELAELKPSDFPWDWEALSAKDNGLAREFEVVVEDAEGLTAKATDHLDVQLPQSGAEKCSFEDLGKGAVTSVISALKYTPDAIVAAGTRDSGAGLRLTLWKLDPDCNLLTGWPRTIVDWTAKPTFKTMTSLGAAVDVDEAGNIIVAGNFVTGGKLQSYVARLTPDGARQWEKEGQVGDEVTGVAAATAQFKNRVFVVGAQRTSDVPVRTDGAIWVYIADDESAFIQPPLTLKAPFTPEEFELDEQNLRNEKVHAVVIQPGTGNAMAVGEREFKPDPNKLYYRAFTVFVHPLGDLVGTPWTSEADASLPHDAARSVAVCDDGFMAGGWTRDEPVDAKPQPMMFWIGADGSSTQHRPEPQLASTQIQGIACDREGKIVSAGTRTAGSPDAQVFTVLGPFGPRTPYETGVQGDDGAGAVACDWRGICGWGGFRTANMKPYAFVRVHHP